jgi:hypothetical protein
MILNIGGYSMPYKNMIEVVKEQEKIPTTEDAKKEEVQYVYDPKTKTYQPQNELYLSTEGFLEEMSRSISKTVTFVRDRFTSDMSRYNVKINNTTSLHTNDNAYIREYDTLVKKFDKLKRSLNLSSEQMDEIYHKEVKHLTSAITRGFKGQLISVSNKTTYPAFTQVDDYLKELFPILTTISESLFRITSAVANNPIVELSSIKSLFNKDIEKALDDSDKFIKSSQSLYNDIITTRTNHDYATISKLQSIPKNTPRIWDQVDVFARFTKVIEESFYFNHILGNKRTSQNAINKFNGIMSSSNKNINIILADTDVIKYLKTNTPKERYLEIMKLTESTARLNTIFASLLYILNQIIIMHTNVVAIFYGTLGNLKQNV